MDSEVAATNDCHPEPAPQIIDFIKKHKIQHGKIDVLDFGPYTLIIRNPGHGVFNTQLRFGYGFTTEDATASVLWRIMRNPDNIDENFRKWLGPELFIQLESLVRTMQEVEAEVQTMITNMKPIET